MTTQELVSNLFLKDYLTPVELIFFSQKDACASCLEQEALLREASSLSSKIQLVKYDFVLDGDEVMNYRVDKIPATTIVGNRGFGIRFYRLTTGYEFSSLIRDIVMVSSGQTGLDPRLEVLVRTIAEPVHLQVMVSLTCPHCTSMVRVAHQLAFADENIRADVVDLTQFPYLALRYVVHGTPKTVINENASFMGAMPAPAVFLEILKVVNPVRYRQIQSGVT